MVIRVMDWEAFIGQKVRIYRNLNNGRMSLQAHSGKSWLVVGHVTDCVIGDVTFRVGEGARQRVIATGQKNVHAWGEGKLLGEFDPSIIAPVDLAYDPYTNTTFVERGTQTPITTCRYLVVVSNRVWVSPDAVPHVPPVPRQPKPATKQLPLFFGIGMQLQVA